MEGVESHQEAKRAQQGEVKSHQAMAGETGPLAGTLTPSKSVDRPHYKVMIPNEMHHLIYCTCPVIHYMGISTSISCLESMLLPDTKLSDLWKQSRLRMWLI